MAINSKTNRTAPTGAPWELTAEDWNGLANELDAETQARIAADVAIQSGEAIPLDQMTVTATGSLTGITLADRAAFEVRPESFGAIGDGSSHPLSERYATLAEAQAVYPHAVALTDEIDWCAWQAAANYLYDQGQVFGDYVPNWEKVYNFAGGKIRASGSYVVNRTITINLATFVIEGDAAIASTFRGSTTIVYNGDDGTLDEPVYILDCYVFDEFFDAPPGLKNGYTSSGGFRGHITRINFVGKGAAMTGGTDDVDVSGFVSGIRLRTAQSTQVTECGFYGTLWDGISCTGAQLFLQVKGNHFYGIHRDALSIHACTGGANFSTTTWIYFNEFGLTGRYHILADLYGSTQPDPIIYGNDFEANLTSSFFYRNTDWFVHGVPASTCFIGASGMKHHCNRYEMTPTENLWGEVHVVGGYGVSFFAEGLSHLFFTAHDKTTPATAAWIAYRTAYGFVDITDERAYNVGRPGQVLGSQAATWLNLTDLPWLTNIFQADGGGIGSDASISNSGGSNYISAYAIETVAGTYSARVAQRDSAVWSMFDLPAFARITNATTFSSSGTFRYGQFDKASKIGNAVWLRGSSFLSRWVANTAYYTNRYGTKKNAVIPTLANENGCAYICIVAGTSDASTEPTWPTTLGATVADGTCTWACVATDVGNANYVAAAGSAVQVLGGMKTLAGTTYPTAGTWLRGDKVMNTNTTSGGNIGWVCTTGGSPGTWKAYGTIA